MASNSYILLITFEGDLSAKKYMAITGVAKATATRHLAELLAKGALSRLDGGGRQTRYAIQWPDLMLTRSGNAPKILTLVLPKVYPMATTRLSSKGQVIIPKPVRTAHKWKPGQELDVIDTDEGVLLKPKAPFPPSTLDDVAGSLAYRGKAKSLADMELAIARGVREKNR